MEIRSYRDLGVWQRGVDLTLIAYALAQRLPSSERYELSAQIRRAATSIPANVAEGHARRGKAYLHHVRIALGSLAELETHVEVARRLGFLSDADVASLLKETTPLGKMLHGLRRSLVRRLLSKVAASTAVAWIVIGALL
jgi:four helix bundle protein